MTFTTIAIMAESGHGKDFCGSWIMKNQQFIDMAFADHIKRLCRTIFRSFTDEALWGDASLRNVSVPINWEEAEYRFTWGIDDWLGMITNLSIEEKLDYKEVVKAWFQEVRHRSFGEGAEVKGNLTPRLALQLLGTEYGRTFKKSIWGALIMKQIVPQIAEGHSYYDRKMGLMPFGSGMKPIQGVVVTDCRYLSEMQEVQGGGGYVIKIVRNSLKGKDNTAAVGGIKNHSSEAELRNIPDEYYDLVLEMDDGAENVYPRLAKMFEDREFETRRKQGLTPWSPK